MGKIFNAPSAKEKVENINEKDHAFVLDINVRALTCMTRICLPYMENGSHIIQLCSGSAFLPQPYFASYAASKSYVLSFSRALLSITLSSTT